MEKRINKIRKKLSADNATKPVSRSGPMKTLLVRVMTDDLKKRLEKRRKKPEVMPQVISNNAANNLRMLLDDYTKMKEAILQVYWQEFKDDHVGLMCKFAQPASKKIDQNKLKPEMDEKGNLTTAGFACSQCGQPLFVYKLEQVSEKGKAYTNYFGRCNVAEHEKLILLAQLKPEKDSDEAVTYSLGKFGQRALDFYSIHVTKESTHPVKPLAQIAGNRYASGPVGKALSDACMGTIASFLSKYQDIIIEHQKVVKGNQKRLESLRELAGKENLEYPSVTLPPQPHTKEGVDAYNEVIARVRMWVNLNLWQKLKLSRDDAKPLLRLKGFPSFPVVERRENEVDWWNTINEVKKLIDAKRDMGRVFWSGVTAEKRNTILEGYNYLPNENDHKKREGSLENPKKPAKRQFGDLLLYLEKKYAGDWGKVFDEAWERIDKKIAGLTSHIEREEARNAEDAQSKAVLTDWLRAKASFVLERLKEMDEKEFYACEIQLQKWYGDLRGNPFAVEAENRVVDISGFSIGSDGHSIQYRNLLAWKYLENGKREFYLLMNYGKKGRIRFTDGTDIKKSGKWQGLLYGGGKAKVIDLTFDPDDEQLIILPLAFGTRQGREFIWNDLLSLETGLIKLANGRVIEKTIYNKKIGRDEPALFVALTFERREVVDPSNIKPVNLIGVDRGENIPAVIALTDPEGCPLPEFKDSSGGPTDILRIGEGYKEKQRAIQAAKEVEQRRAGGYSRKFASKSRNLADDMVRNSARDLFYHAVTHDAVLVFENLSRGFGRQGKRTFMTERQYTKMEDWLTAKLAYEGLTSKTYLSKTLAQYTSKTCSNCGFTITTADYDGMLVRLKKTSDGWATTLNNKELKAEGQITYYNRYKRQTVEKELSAELDRLSEESGNNDISKWTKGRRDEALFLLKKRFSHRPVQEQFVCLDCGHEVHADEQAALNIARSWLFLNSNSTEFKSYKSGKQPFVGAWQAFYKRRLKEVWKPNA
ncbi:MAG: hypothetical protein A3G39_04675 [Deltaproteobacteria bacterium RIFCSPLOWO2_12_FULL_43_16]|uniref:Uncharacterized protein n=1 Tax=Deltaproteobacteria bacterium TaxID=2026735 RepID=A0ACD6B9V1_UNCDE|nr:MAG: hypothetical protein A2Z89_08250 [Deltaproteobacteria bacterium GWA2_43_19]OGQ11037.1 MAG: hypothetical protein A3D30_10280 [Deltaproteobacteria bacterium RIFCSPHIGHO2_02_FULL_43_33]OGQ57168.1 MAG: hypothetical protein A3G39_04675 [Deltaproteobacteria bacterium RIFCSPLOWO2_12_FULL_43_16]HBR17948.1 hypothetical protein [Deltaproteobacteria bacterium]